MEITTYQQFYFAALFLCLIVSCLASISNRALRIFPYLLSLSIITEIAVMIVYYRYNGNYNLIYHIYIPLEYSLLAAFFYTITQNKTVKRMVLISIPFYVLCSLLLSLFVTSIAEHPGWNFNLEGVLLITWCLITLFTMEPLQELPLLKLPVFWICLGILVFHSGIFFFNGVYAYLQGTNLQTAEHLNQLIIKNLNYLLYLCFTVGFLCAIRMRKYTLPL